MALEFLGFEAPTVSATLAIQQRRSLGFAAWALTNDPANARFALDLVKRMKKAARQARSKPGHAWDAYAEMAEGPGADRHEICCRRSGKRWGGRSRTTAIKPMRAGPSTSRSKRSGVHAIESDRARRRDVVLEFVLVGLPRGQRACPTTATTCRGSIRRRRRSPSSAICARARSTRGGMAPWATHADATSPSSPRPAETRRRRGAREVAGRSRRNAGAGPGAEPVLEVVQCRLSANAS